MMNRRQFSTMGLITAASLALSRGATAANAKKFHFAVVSDPHVIDEFYHGQESNAEDTESLHQANARLTAARDTINSIPAIEQVFVPGDVFTTILRRSTTSTSRTRRASTTQRRSSLASRLPCILALAITITTTAAPCRGR